ncbi:MAG: M14 family zinc carboxypeptidase [Gemmatimonadaceae bacterium]
MNASRIARIGTVVALAAAALGGCRTQGGEGTQAVPPPGGEVRPIPRGVPLTRAERTNYRETSSYDDVVAFLDSLQARGAVMTRGSIGRTSEGREIPYVIASRPLVRTPEEARALDRPIMYLQGNIHGGEVEGKEALQMLLRDLLLDPAPNLLDSLVIIAVPIYNADGNEAWGPQEKQRGSQNGPEQVGRRPNAQALNLNRDYIKAEAPETRGSLAMFNLWDPHLFMDLHTTNGSYHGYALTYSPSLHPGAPLAEYTSEVLLAQVRQRVAERTGFPIYDYGNFGRGDLTDTVKTAWRSYDHRPRYGSNYYGLRNRVGVLSEAYSHDPLDRRVAATYAFVREVLGWTAENATGFLARVRAQDASGGQMASGEGQTVGVALRAALPDSAPSARIVFEDLVSTGDSTRTEAGVPKGIRRTGNYRAQLMPSFTRFEATYSRDVPEAFAVPASDSAAVRLLRLHGVQVGRLTRPWTGEVHAFVIDSVVPAEREFEGHREMRLEGERWASGRRELPAGTFIVSGTQRLARLALVLLDPMSDDGLVTWNVFDPLTAGDDFPVLQIRRDVPTDVTPLP